jgi:hypothetical protein
MCSLILLAFFFNSAHDVDSIPLDMDPARSYLDTIEGIIVKNNDADLFLSFICLLLVLCDSILGFFP